MGIFEVVGDGFGWITERGHRWRLFLFILIIGFIFSWTIAVVMEPGKEPLLIDGHFDGEYYNGRTIIDEKNRISFEEGCRTQFCYEPAEIYFRGNITYGEQRVTKYFDEVILRGDFEFDYIEVSPATIPTWLETSGDFNGELIEPVPIWEWVEDNLFDVILIILLIGTILYYNYKREPMGKRDLNFIREKYREYLPDEWYIIGDIESVPDKESLETKSDRAIAMCKNKMTDEVSAIMITITGELAGGYQKVDTELLEDTLGLPYAKRREENERSGRMYDETDMMSREAEINALRQQLEKRKSKEDKNRPPPPPEEEYD